MKEVAVTEQCVHLLQKVKAPRKYTQQKRTLRSVKLNGPKATLL